MFKDLGSYAVIRIAGREAAPRVAVSVKESFQAVQQKMKELTQKVTELKNVIDRGWLA